MTKTGLYFQDPKYQVKLQGKADFIFDPSLGLYVPLYKLDGASFMSRDAYGHLCTVTGVLMTPRGGDFDGVDDYVDLGTDTWSEADFAGGLTLEAWVKFDVAGDVLRVFLSIEARMRLHLRADGTPTLNFYDGVTNEVYANNPVQTGQWYHIVGTWDGTNMLIYVGGEQQADSNTSNVGLIDPVSRKSVVGDYPPQSGCVWFDGLIGEVRIYNRALNPLEIQHNYLATKWRYR